MPLADNRPGISPFEYDASSPGTHISKVKAKDGAEADSANTIENAELPSDGENESKREPDDVYIVNDQRQHTCIERWGNFIECRKLHLVRVLKQVALYCATRPFKTVFFVMLFSFFMVGVGLATNFKIETESDYLWTPIGSRPMSHRNWIKNDSGFGASPQYIRAQINKGGDDVLGLEGVRRVFEVLDLIKSQPEYFSACSKTEEEINARPSYRPCTTTAVTGFWNHNSSLFEAFVANATHYDVLDAISSLTFPSGKLVNRVGIFGTVDPPVHDNAYGNVYDHEKIRLKSAKAYHLNTIISSETDDEASSKLEKNTIDALLELRRNWKSDPNSDWQLEFLTTRSFDDELERGIVGDIPLMIIAFVIVGLFCVVYFAKRDRVLSRSSMGIGAVLSVLLALMTGYGLLFCIGVPFTSLTQIFPFILVGIGLDDGFIIIGAFDRANPNASVLRRIEEAMDEIGVSIFVSTLTTFMAFMLGSITQIPAIRWFCFYAGPCIVIDFIYQITFFDAVLTLDQKRIENGLYDIFCCCGPSRPNTTADEVNNESSENICDCVEPTEQRDIEPVSEEEVGSEENAEHEVGENENSGFLSRTMAKYILFILQPRTKVCVIVFFTILLVLGSISASKLDQAFSFQALTPTDSYVDAFLDAMEENSVDNPSFFRVWVYARGVDLTKEENRMAMDKFVNDMADLEHITQFPTYYWHKDFNFFLNQTGVSMKNTSFNEQIAIFLETEPYKTIYDDHIVRDDGGNIIQSRTFMTYDQVDGNDVKNQVEALLDQREVARSQPLNKGRTSWLLFSYADIYTIWEFYDVVVRELVMTTAFAIASVAAVALFFIPHPMGCLIVTFTVSMVYVDLMGLLQIAGLHLNSVTSIGLVMSIGLVVDFVMHIVHIYFEVDGDSREKKVSGALMTIGKSVLIGGFSTFLGTLPLCLGTSEVFWTFFVNFLGIVFLGVSHGIVFVPVVLSLIAPVCNPGKLSSTKQQSSVQPENADV